jgi:ATP-dependent exoDNAse (exonuclease V) alpha subunit
MGDVALFDESFAFEDSRARWLYSGITRGEAAECGGGGSMPLGAA